MREMILIYKNWSFLVENRRKFECGKYKLKLKYKEGNKRKLKKEN